MDRKSKEEENTTIKKKKLIIVAIVVASIFAIYAGVSLYFTDKFLIGSKINSIEVAGKTVEEASETLEKTYGSLEIKLKGRGLEDTIKGKDIELKFNGQEEVKKIQKEQNPFSWFGKLFNSEEKTMEKTNEYNEKKLDGIIEKLKFFEKGKIKSPKSPTLEYDKEKGEYIIKPEELGNKINKEKLKAEIKKSIARGDMEIDLEKLEVYEKPKFTSTSKEVEEVKTNLDKMVNSSIKYEFAGKSYNLNKEQINTWLSVDKNMKVKIDEKKVTKYIYNLASEFNTVGINRSFKTSGGANITVSGGNYGHAIDQKQEKKAIIELLKTGDTQTREPIFSQKGKGYGKNDIGDNYVEISLSGQHIWFYKGGQLLTQGSIVTGNVSRGWGTPPGVYKLTYKQRGAVLRGANYETPVTFWMPFNGGIGLHDATWRNAFGGNIYVGNGSHGCVNLPYNVAEIIFNNISEDTTIVLYY